jgi:proteasome lid subunit RPN8/RPN11
MTTPSRSVEVPAVVLAAGVREVVAARALRSRPREACGVLVGRERAGATVVEHVAPARNLRRCPGHYELAPADWCAAWRAAERRRRELVGVWHSHVGGGAAPSRADLAAAWAGYTYLIAAVSADGVGELRCWRLEEGEFREQRIEVRWV